MKKMVSYLHAQHGEFSQYHGRNAGYYRENISRKDRIKAEISAHQDNVQQMGAVLRSSLEKKGKEGRIELFGREGIYGQMCYSGYLPE